MKKNIILILIFIVLLFIVIKSGALQEAEELKETRNNYQNIYGSMSNDFIFSK